MPQMLRMQAHSPARALAGCPQADQHFIVWMRTAALRNFRKLWGRIEQDIPAGSTLTVLVQNRSNAPALLCPIFALTSCMLPLVYAFVNERCIQATAACV